MRAARHELTMGGSFQRGIASVALVTTAIVLLTACAAFVGQQYGADRRAMQAGNQALAAIVAPHMAQELREGEPGEAARIMADVIRAPGVRSAFLLDAQGRVLAARSRRGAEADLAPGDKDGVAQVRAPMIDRNGVRRGEVVIVSDMGSLAPLLARYLAVTGGLFFAATGLAMFLSSWLAARLIRPIHTLSHAMLELAKSGDTSRRAPPATDEVFDRLTDSFNALMTKLQSNEQVLRHTNRDLVVARDAAETANVLKSQFLANMSHEIRTPLNGVLAMAQLMEMSALEPGQRERLGVIRQSGEALLGVLNDVLDLSKIEAGKLELESADFDVGELSRSVAAAFESAARERGLAFTLELAPSAEGMRRGDPARLRQVLNNLASNAVKFTSLGEVRLRAEGLGPDGADGVVFTVEDTGCGIPADKLPLLFEKFSQVDSSATRRFGGTGLGLAICRELATLMGGAVTVTSVAGRGSVFRVALPFPRTGPAAIARAHVAHAPAPESDERPLRLLAAEDNQTNQRVLRAVLDTFGVDLTLVENGKLAVEAWARGGYDLILMDIQMPEMDGVAATRAIRAAESGDGRPRTPIIALSANAMTHQVAEYLAAGMDAHVPKPIEIARLQAAIEGALEQADLARAA